MVHRARIISIGLVADARAPGSSAPPVGITAPMVVSVVAYAGTVWKARLTPVLLGGPGLTVIWVAGMLLIYGS